MTHNNLTSSDHDVKEPFPSVVAQKHGCTNVINYNNTGCLGKTGLLGHKRKELFSRRKKKRQLDTGTSMSPQRRSDAVLTDERFRTISIAYRRLQI